MKDEALRPASLNFQKFIESKEPAIDSTAEEKILAEGADNAFWKILKDYFDSSLLQLETINEMAIAHGMPLDEIGKNALVISQVKGIIRKITNVVTDAKEARDGRQK